MRLTRSDEPGGELPLDPGTRGGATGMLSARHLLSAFLHAPIAMAVLTPDGVVTGCNDALGRLLHRPSHSLVGRTLFEVTHPDDVEDARRACDRIGDGDGGSGAVRTVRHECRFVRPDGSTRWVVVDTSRVDDAGEADRHLILQVTDLSERKALEEDLLHRTLHDPLTGLPNRVLLIDRIAQALARSQRTPTPTCLFFLDLNGFKAVNDTWGHAAGDTVLQQLATRLTALLRPGDTAARLSGDEFAVLCESTDLAQSAVIAERLRVAAAEPFRLDGPEGPLVTLTAAVGVGTAPAGVDGVLADPAALLRRADLHMYDAKRRPAGERAET